VRTSKNPIKQLSQHAVHPGDAHGQVANVQLASLAPAGRPCAAYTDACATLLCQHGLQSLLLQHLLLLRKQCLPLQRS
jgi:hypothetical protein